MRKYHPLSRLLDHCELVHCLLGGPGGPGGIFSGQHSVTTNFRGPRHTVPALAQKSFFFFVFHQKWTNFGFHEILGDSKNLTDDFFVKKG